MKSQRWSPRARSDLGPPDIVVANAGVATRHPTTHMSPADFAAIVAVNLGGVQHLFGAVIAGMCDRGGGRLLATSSTSGVLYGWSGHAAYCAAKSRHHRAGQDLRHRVRCARNHRQRGGARRHPLAAKPLLKPHRVPRTDDGNASPNRLLASQDHPPLA